MRTLPTYSESGIMNPESVNKILQQSRHLNLARRQFISQYHGVIWQRRKAIEEGRASPFDILKKIWNNDTIGHYWRSIYTNRTSDKNHTPNYDKIIRRLFACYCKFNQRYGINAHCGNRRICNRGNLQEWAENWKIENLK